MGRSHAKKLAHGSSPHKGLRGGHCHSVALPRVGVENYNAHLRIPWAARRARSASGGLGSACAGRWPLRGACALHAIDEATNSDDDFTRVAAAHSIPEHTHWAPIGGQRALAQTR